MTNYFADKTEFAVIGPHLEHDLVRVQIDVFQNHHTKVKTEHDDVSMNRVVDQARRLLRHPGAAHGGLLDVV